MDSMVLTTFSILENNISKAKNAFSFYLFFRKRKPKYSKQKKHNEGHYLGSEPAESTRTWEEWLATQAEVSLMFFVIPNLIVSFLLLHLTGNDTNHTPFQRQGEEESTEEKRLFSLSDEEGPSMVKEKGFARLSTRAKMILGFNLWITQHRFFLKPDVNIY